MYFDNLWRWWYLWVAIMVLCGIKSFLSHCWCCYCCKEDWHQIQYHLGSAIDGLLWALCCRYFMSDYKRQTLDSLICSIGCFSTKEFIAPDFCGWYWMYDDDKEGLYHLRSILVILSMNEHPHPGFLSLWFMKVSIQQHRYCLWSVLSMIGFFPSAFWCFEMKVPWSIVQSSLVLVELCALQLWRRKCWSDFWLLVSDVKLIGDQKHALFIWSLLMTTSEGIGIWWIINCINNRTSVFVTPFCWCEIRTWRCLGGYCLTLIEYIFFVIKIIPCLQSRC